MGREGGRWGGGGLGGKEERTKEGIERGREGRERGKSERERRRKGS